MRESALDRRVKAAIKRRWPLAFVRKLHGGEYQSGLLDLLVIVEGRAIMLEDKQKSEKLTRLQEVEQGKIRRAGGLAERVDDPRQAVALIEKALDEIR
jgi:hypothetical protein